MPGGGGRFQFNIFHYCRNQYRINQRYLQKDPMIVEWLKIHRALQRTWQLPRYLPR